MKIATDVNHQCIKWYVQATQVFPFILLGFVVYLLSAGESFAAGTNHLSGLKDDVVATFGAGSDMQYFLLLAEGLGGAYAYTKTKNIAVLAGVPLLMVFTHWALK